MNKASISCFPLSGTTPLFLDKNENPFSLPPSPREELRQILCQAPLNRYPEGRSSLLRAKLADYVKTDESQIIIGNGGDEILYLLFLALIDQGGPILTLEPTFSEYSHLSRIFRRERRCVPIELDGNGFSLNEEAFIDAIALFSPAMILLDCPNNPTGIRLSSSFLRRVIELAPCLVIVDEAYVEFSGNSIIDLFREKRWPSNLIVLRTLSKAWGLAGLRLGYAVADSDLVSDLDSIRPPYNINALSQEAAQIVLGYREWMESRVFSLRYIRDHFIQEINRLDGWEAYESEANYVMVTSPWDKTKTETLLTAENIHVRFIEMPGRKETFLRVSIGKEEEMRRFLSLLEEQEEVPSFKEMPGA